jgi:hypothetical protein
MKDDVSHSPQEPRIKNVYFGKLPSLPPPEPLTPEEKDMQKFLALEESLLAMTERNNPQYLDSGIARSRAKIAKKKAELNITDEKMIYLKNLIDKHNKYL